MSKEIEIVNWLENNNLRVISQHSYKPTELAEKVIVNIHLNDVRFYGDRISEEKLQKVFPELLAIFQLHFNQYEFIFFYGPEEQRDTAKLLLNTFASILR